MVSAWPKRTAPLLLPLDLMVAPPFSDAVLSFELLVCVLGRPLQALDRWPQIVVMHTLNRRERVAGSHVEWLPMLVVVDVGRLSSDTYRYEIRRHLLLRGGRDLAGGRRPPGKGRRALLAGQGLRQGPSERLEKGVTGTDPPAPSSTLPPIWGPQLYSARRRGALERSSFLRDPPPLWGVRNRSAGRVNAGRTGGCLAVQAAPRGAKLLIVSDLASQMPT
jgi:hypothetical protein